MITSKRLRGVATFAALGFILLPTSITANPAAPAAPAVPGTKAAPTSAGKVPATTRPSSTSQPEAPAGNLEELDPRTWRPFLTSNQGANVVIVYDAGPAANRYLTVIEELAAKGMEGVRFGKLDGNRHGSLAARDGITKFPAVRIYTGGGFTMLGSPHLKSAAQLEATIAQFMLVRVRRSPEAAARPASTNPTRVSTKHAVVRPGATPPPESRRDALNDTAPEATRKQPAIQPLPAKSDLPPGIQRAPARRSNDLPPGVQPLK